MTNELMKRLSELPSVIMDDGQEYIQLYDVMETIKRAEQDLNGDLISKQLIKSEYERKLKETLIDKDRNIDLTEYADCSSFNEFIDSIPPIKPQSCEDAISRQAVLSMQYRIDDSATLSTRDVVNVDDIEDLPPVKPQEKTGYWEWVQYDSNPNIGNWHCTECRCVVECVDKDEKGGIPLYKYCPQCGARMVEPLERSEE